MIRGLFLLLLFAAGLAAAAVYQGRMHHLRQALPERLPAWTGTVAAQAGLRRGTMDLPAQGRWPATRLGWTARMPTRAGWVWDVTLNGEGVALEGLVTLAFPVDRASLSDVTGSLDLGALAVVPVPVQGIARIEALTGTAADLRGDPVLSGALAAGIPALTLGGADFGTGPLTASLDATGAWRADLALAGGISPLQADIAGTLSGPAARLQAIFADGPALPASLRAMLAAAGQAQGQGWRLTADVPMP